MKYCFLTIAFTSLYLSGLETTLEPPRSTIKVVSLAHATEDDLKGIMEGQHPELALECLAHTLLPITFYLRGDLVHLTEGDAKCETLEIKDTFYIRYVGEELLLSSNLVEWKTLSEFITGVASISLNIQDGQPSIIVGSEINQRR